MTDQPSKDLEVTQVTISNLGDYATLSVEVPISLDLTLERAKADSGVKFSCEMCFMRHVGGKPSKIVCPEIAEFADGQDTSSVLLQWPDDIVKGSDEWCAITVNPYRESGGLRPKIEWPDLGLLARKLDLTEASQVLRRKYWSEHKTAKGRPALRGDLVVVAIKRGAVTQPASTLTDSIKNVIGSQGVRVALQSVLRCSPADMVAVAVMRKQGELFQEILCDLDHLKKERISFETKDRDVPLFTGMKAYELLDKCMDTAMLAHMVFEYDVHAIVDHIESMWQQLSGESSEAVENMVKTEVDNYFGNLCGKVVPAYLKHINELRGIYKPGNPDNVLDGDVLDGDEWIIFSAERLRTPALCELIWNYWHEEGMQIQTMHAINLRFQNKMQRPDMHRLASLNTSPLRPLSSLLWGYIQSEPQRLSVRRRNYEYDHAYGISLHGKAVLDFTPADSRTTFLKSFHRLLNLCTAFYKQLDDTTVAADAFPVKNALRDVHLILAEGAHNQYGDLPWAARKEMLIEQYMLSLPEMREFLGGRSMVPYREPWMENVDTMKRLQQWTNTGIEQFNTLARVGEQILVTIRFGEWNSPDVQVGRAFAWAAMLRPWVQEYIHSYDAVTGVDLRDPRQVDETMPSVHLRRRLEAQTGRAA